MLAGVLHGKRDMRVEKVPRPALRPGQVLLRVRRVGICGTDSHYFLHGYCGAFVPSRPFILGHEVVAIVEEVGEAVDRPTVGQRVVVNPASSCGQCEACQSGRRNLCSRVVMLGSASTTPPTDGAFAEYVAVADYQCYPLDESIDDSLGAMMEPLSVALHAIRRNRGVIGARVMVSGGGPIGLLSAVVARTLGASLVVVSEPTVTRQGTALRLGVDHVLNPIEDGFVSQAIEISDGGFDVVFEASGTAAAVTGGMAVLRRGGSMVQIGTVGANSVALPVNDLMVREISLLGTFRYADEFPEALRLMAGGRMQLEPLVTGIYPLSEIIEAMNAASSANGALKVQVALDT
jgi:L-idonate 5-dehydrogenase